MKTTEEDRLLRTLGPDLFASGSALHDRLTTSGCSSYVKTIYIGYDLDGVMVAALYPHTNRVEVALALPEDHESKLLIDATHLTWRTLPVAAVLRGETDLEQVLRLIDEACLRIATGSHEVERPNDYFVKSRRETDLGSHRPSG
jgi:hypothetical protein